MNNKKVTELRQIAKELNVKNYSKLSKAELITAIESTQQVTDINNREEVIDMNEIVTVQETPIDNNFIIKDFEIEQYAKFIPSNSMKSTPISAKQLNLVKALENNFKVSINTTDCKNFYELSDKLSKVYQAILSGKVQRRDYADVQARVKTYKPTEDNKATKYQLELINKLEKKTGFTVKTVISSKKIASEVITMLLNKEKEMISEVAVTIDERLANPNFRNKFTAMMKRIFA